MDMYFVFSCKITGVQLFSFKGFVLIHLNWSTEFLSGCTIYLIFSYLDHKYALPFLLKLTDSMTKLVMLSAYQSLPHWHVSSGIWYWITVAKTHEITLVCFIFSRSERINTRFFLNWFWTFW